MGAHAHSAGSKGLTLAPTGEGAPPHSHEAGLGAGLSRLGVSARPPDIQAPEPGSPGHAGCAESGPPSLPTAAAQCARRRAPGPRHVAGTSAWRTPPGRRAGRTLVKPLWLLGRSPAPWVLASFAELHLGAPLLTQGRARPKSGVSHCHQLSDPVGKVLRGGAGSCRQTAGLRRGARELTPAHAPAWPCGAVSGGSHGMGTERSDQLPPGQRHPSQPGCPPPGWAPLKHRVLPSRLPLRRLGGCRWGPGRQPGSARSRGRAPSLRRVL